MRHRKARLGRKQGSQSFRPFGSAVGHSQDHSRLLRGAKREGRRFEDAMGVFRDTLDGGRLRGRCAVGLIGRRHGQPHGHITVSGQVLEDRGPIGGVGQPPMDFECTEHIGDQQRRQ